MENVEYKVGGVFRFEHIRDGKVIDSWDTSNIVVNQGLNYILDAALSNGVIIPTWYIGLFKNNYTPIATDVKATFTGSGVANEATTEYSETIRPTWVDAGAASQSISNSASPAVFTFASAVTIYGALMTSTNTKGDTAGTLLAAAKFTTSKVMAIADQLNISYIISATST
jgi:hypothetical protein